MSDSPDAQLQLKKRARRRLVGAVAFAGLAAIILPMVMDEEPKQQVQDVQIRIPGQDQAPFAPNLKPLAAEKKEAKEAEAASQPVKTVEAVDSVAGKGPEKTTEKVTEKAPEKPKPQEKPVSAVKPPEKEPAKPTEKAVEHPADGKDAQRAAAILGGKAVDNPAPSANGQFVILIGAFANQANVKQLQTKIGELGVRVFTEPLDTPGGRKTRVRAGPFPSKEAAQKALDRMKRIGVNGVVAAKQ